MANDVDIFDWPHGEPQDVYPTMSVTLGELVDGGWVDPDKPEWRWDAYDDAQYRRVWQKIEQHYWRREIGVLPPGDWRREFIRKMDEIMPKYKPVYKMLEEGANIFTTGEDYGKNRTMLSDFPATQIQAQENDYASNATDAQHDDIHQGDWIQKMADLKNYDDVDLMIVDEIGTMFSSIITPAINFM